MYRSRQRNAPEPPDTLPLSAPKRGSRAINTVMARGLDLTAPENGIAHRYNLRQDIVLLSSVLCTLYCDHGTLSC